MYGPNEEMLKKMAMQQEARQTDACCGSIGTSIDKECARPSLMERVQSQRNRAQQEARQADRLAELQFLLEKNPEVARILDLMDGLKG